MENEAIKLLKESKRIIKEHPQDASLPSGCYFLKGGNILALPNPDGDARYPYSLDGFTLWAYSSGNITLNESNFFIFPPELEGKEPYVSFFGGIKNKDRFDVFSLSGSADTELGREFDVYVIFNKEEFKYIREYKKVIFCLKGKVDSKRAASFELEVINKSKKLQEVLLSSYFNPLLTHGAFETEETKWFRTCSLKANGAEFHSVEDLSREEHLHSYLDVKVQNKAKDYSAVSSRKDYVGNKNYSISQSRFLREGSFENSKQVSTFTNMAAYGDLNKITLQPNESYKVSYELELRFGENSKNDVNSIQKPNKNEKIAISFGKFTDSEINNELFNKFIASVVDQVDYCANAKNSSLMLLGIRDLYQMLEVSLLWNKENAKKKILESLNYITLEGRAMRQYAAPSTGKDALVDSREFIDQGQWIISTIWKYLAFTNDYSILNEKCGYVELKSKKQATLIDKQETVYEHLCRIIHYLISNIDEDTHCLRTLYGDWNDAVDGLGASNKGKEYGNGVSVMATEHLYLNLLEMDDIADFMREETIYLETAEQVLRGFMKYAVKDNRIVHGWGEDKSFYVGSKCDVDNKDRYSVTSHAFYVISKMYKKHPELKESILEAYEALDSKYGYKTFNEYFDREDAYKVGRIVNLPKGTAENAATYIHGAMFAVRSLLLMNEGKKAFEQISKLIPLTHNKISVSPFVMPNSYGYNKELGIDGESMNDWYTGSSNTLLKAIIFDMFGIKPKIGDEVEINPVREMPSKEANISLTIKGKRVDLHYRNKGKGKRTILANGNKLESNKFDVSDYPKKITIEVID